MTGSEQCGEIGTVAEFCELVRDTSPEELRRRFPNAVLLETRGPGADAPHSRRSQTVSPEDTHIRPLAPHEARIFFVCKHVEGSVMRHVTVGRTPNNDLHLPHPSVSKLHAFFMVPGPDDPPQGARLVDVSTQGTFVDGERLPRETPFELPTTLTPTDRPPNIAFAAVHVDYFPDVSSLCTILLGVE